MTKQTREEMNYWSCGVLSGFIPSCSFWHKEAKHSDTDSDYRVAKRAFGNQDDFTSVPISLSNHVQTSEDLNTTPSTRSVAVSKSESEKTPKKSNKTKSRLKELSPGEISRRVLFIQ